MSFSHFRPRRALLGALPLFTIVLVPSLGLLTRAGLAQTTARKAVSHDEWVGIYLGKQKIGYSGTHYAPITYHDAPAVQATTHGITKMQLLGSAVEQEEDTETILDLQDRQIGRAHV